MPSYFRLQIELYTDLASELKKIVMKKIYNSILLLIAVLSNLSSSAQQNPVWIQNLNTLPDSAYLFPVKTMTDLNDNVITLSTYYKLIPPSAYIYKVVMNKFDSSGNLLWTLDFDNGGSGKPRGFDMVVDYSGNSYIAGGFTDNQYLKPMLLKVSDAGSVIWMRDSANNFNTSEFEQILIKNDFLYLRCNSGVAVFDNNGNEQWSEARTSVSMAVDNLGRMLVSTFPNPTETIIRYNTNGTIDFSDSSIVADRITIDYNNNIYLLAQWSNYNLAKHDSSGVFQWWTDAFPQNLSFGDQGLKLLVDYENNILLVGLADTMYKYRPDGSRIWMKPMNGLDSYIIDAQIVNSNFLCVVGSPPTFVPSIKVSMFDLNGTEVWSGVHQANVNQEFAVSLAASGEGIYILEDSMSGSSLLKFDAPWNSGNIDYNLLCVDSVWYEPGNPQLVNIRVFNGNFAHLNYPSIQMVSANGDTISNLPNMVNFFAHIGNHYLIYQDSIIQSGITDFSNHSFAMSEGFGDTIVGIGWCATVDVNNPDANKAILYPNPASNNLTIKFRENCQNCELEIFSREGKLYVEEKMTNEINVNMNIESLPAGLYILKIKNQKGLHYFRFVKI